MIISNSLGKNKIDSFSTANVFMKSDGFRKIAQRFSSNKIKAPPPEEKPQHKLHTSSGFRRITK